MRSVGGAIVVFAAVLASGCVQEQRYITPEGGGPWAFAVDESTPPFFTSRDGTLFLVEQRVEIPFREPTAEEQAATGDIGDAQIPYAYLPWLKLGDIEVQLDYTVSNLATDRTVDVAVTINGFNEFTEYVPGVQVIENRIVPDFSGWERTIRLGPGERHSGTVRQEELDEIAVDLATIVNGAPNANQILHPQSQSAIDPRSQMYIPDVIPSILGLRAGMRVEADPDAPPTLVMELTVRVRDVRGVLVQGDDDPWVPPAPAIVMPTPMMQAP